MRTPTSQHLFANGAKRLVLASSGGMNAAVRLREHDAVPVGAADAVQWLPFSGVQFHPADLAKRQTAAWHGLSGEIVRIIRQEPFESSYCGRSHLLIAYERAARDHGESTADGLPRSTLRDFSDKLTFVPAGHRFHESQNPRVPMRATYLYIDPEHQLIGSKVDFTTVELAPRLFFESPVLWQTALKLKALIEGGAAASRLYAEALGVVLAHEVLRLQAGMAGPIEPPVRGGLAGWQRRLVTQFLEDNLAEQISLSRLAQLAQLSPYHFCRAFKQSFGMPPHRYHTTRRIERAKMLLAKPTASVTAVAMEVGFRETSSFTAAFRKLAGATPTQYRRNLL
jgi:AraC family transcriptional regulator